MEIPTSTEEYFSIRTDVIWFYGHLSNPIEILTPVQKRCLADLGSFLNSPGENHWKGFAELWKLYKELEGFTDGQDNPDYPLKSRIRDMGLKGFYFGRGLSYENGEPIGVFIAQPVFVNYRTHPGDFFKLFAYRFIFLSTEYKKEFLDYHFQETFDKNPEEYRAFLNLAKSDYKEIFGDNIDFVNQYIDWLKQGQVSGLTVDNTRQTPTYRQLALAIALRQKVKSIPDFAVDKVERLKKLAIENNLPSWKKLQTEYNSFTNVREGRNESNWREFLNKGCNLTALRELLKNDSAALLELDKHSQNR